MDWKFCPYCAGMLKGNLRGKQSCESCGKDLYQNPKSTTGFFLFDAENHLVLSIRRLDPYKGMMDTIGGYLDIGESIEEALLRELKEETGLLPADITTPKYLGSAYVESPFMGYAVPVECIMFTAQIKRDELQANDDIVGFERLNKSDIDISKIAWGKEMLPLITAAFARYTA